MVFVLNLDSMCRANEQLLLNGVSIKKFVSKRTLKKKVVSKRTFIKILRF